MGKALVGGILLVALVSCSKPSSALDLPTPAPDSLLIEANDATFRLVGTVQVGGVRGSSGGDMLGLDDDGYPSEWGSLLMEDIESIHSSTPCRPSDPPDRETVIHFGPRWTPEFSRPPTRRGSPWLPTRFDAKVDRLLDLDGRRIQAWGTLDAGTSVDCTTLVAQYIEAL